MNSDLATMQFSLEESNSPIMKNRHINLESFKPVVKSNTGTVITYDVLPNTKYMLALAITSALTHLTITDQDDVIQSLDAHANFTNNGVETAVHVQILYLYFKTGSAQSGIKIVFHSSGERATTYPDLCRLDIDPIRQIQVNAESWYNVYMESVHPSAACEYYLRLGIPYSGFLKRIEKLAATAADPAKGTTEYTVAADNHSWYDLVFYLDYCEQALGTVTLTNCITETGALGVTFIPVRGYNRVRIFTTSAAGLTFTFAHADLATAVTEIKCYKVTRPALSSIIAQQ